MQQQLSVITLGTCDLARSRRFYAEGFGWQPVFESPEIIFYQLNGFVLGTWRDEALAADSGRTALSRPGAFSLAHNVASPGDVHPTLDRLIQYGGRLLRSASVPSYGGLHGYVADPDDHTWETAWNPAWPISPEGFVKFGL